MRLREFFCIREEEDDRPSNGVPEPIDHDAFLRTAPWETQRYGNQPGAGPLSNGIPEPIGGGYTGPMYNPRAGGSPRPSPQQDIGRAKTQFQPITRGAKTDPLINWQPPPGAFMKSPPPSPKRPVSSAGSPPPGERQVGPQAKTTKVPVMAAPPEAKAAVHPWQSGEGPESNGVPEPIGNDDTSRLAEFFNIGEMARPKGAIGKDMRAVIDFASRQGGDHPLSARQLFAVYCRSKGIGAPTKPQYMSFKTTLNRFTARSPEEVDATHPFLQQDLGRPNRGSGDDTSTVYTFAGAPGWSYSPNTGGAPTARPQGRTVARAQQRAMGQFDEPTDEPGEEPESGAEGGDENDPFWNPDMSGDFSGGEDTDEGEPYDPFSSGGGEEEDGEEPAEPRWAQPAATVFKRRRA